MWPGLPVLMEPWWGLHVAWSASAHGNMVGSVCGLAMDCQCSWKRGGVCMWPGLPVLMETWWGLHVAWTASAHGNVVGTACGLDCQCSWKRGGDCMWPGLPVLMETWWGLHVAWNASGHGNMVGTACGHGNVVGTEDRGVSENEMNMGTYTNVGYLHWLVQLNVPEIQEFHVQGLYQEIMPSFDLTCLCCHLVWCSKLIIFTSEVVIENIQIQQDSSVRSLCPTRWTVRTGAMQAIVTNYETLQSTIEVSSHGTDDCSRRAGGVLAVMQSFRHTLASSCLF